MSTIKIKAEINITSNCQVYKTDFFKSLLQSKTQRQRKAADPRLTSVLENMTETINRLSILPILITGCSSD